MTQNVLPGPMSLEISPNALTEALGFVEYNMISAENPLCTTKYCIALWS